MKGKGGYFGQSHLVDKYDKGDEKTGKMGTKSKKEKR
jgi:hypothetical protein